jgi:hypothetical protein
MTELEELKESTKAAVAAKQAGLERRLASHPPGDQAASEEEIQSIHDTLLDLIADTPLTYKLTVAQAKRMDDPDQIAELWEEARRQYQSMASDWEALDSELRTALGLPLGASGDELWAYWGRMIRKLVQACAEHHDFHALK